MSESPVIDMAKMPTLELYNHFLYNKRPQFETDVEEKMFLELLKRLHDLIQIPVGFVPVKLRAGRKPMERGIREITLEQDGEHAHRLQALSQAIQAFDGIAKTLHGLGLLPQNCYAFPITEFPRLMYNQVLAERKETKRTLKRAEALAKEVVLSGVSAESQEHYLALLPDSLQKEIEADPNMVSKLPFELQRQIREEKERSEF